MNEWTCLGDIARPMVALYAAMATPSCFSKTPWFGMLPNQQTKVSRFAGCCMGYRERECVRFATIVCEFRCTSCLCDHFRATHQEFNERSFGPLTDAVVAETSPSTKVEPSNQIKKKSHGTIFTMDNAPMCAKLWSFLDNFPKISNSQVLF